LVKYLLEYLSKKKTSISSIQSFAKYIKYHTSTHTSLSLCCCCCYFSLSIIYYSLSAIIIVFFTQKHTQIQSERDIPSNAKLSHRFGVLLFLFKTTFRSELRNSSSFHTTTDLDSLYSILQFFHHSISFQFHFSLNFRFYSFSFSCSSSDSNSPLIVSIFFILFRYFFCCLY
jgi:hypothetical protein